MKATADADPVDGGGAGGLSQRMLDAPEDGPVTGDLDATTDGLVTADLDATADGLVRGDFDATTDVFLDGAFDAATDDTARSDVQTDVEPAARPRPHHV